MNLSPSAKNVLVHLALFANKTGECWPALDTLAQVTCLSLATVKRALADLKAAGLVSWEQGGSSKGSNVYRLHVAAMKARLRKKGLMVSLEPEVVAHIEPQGAHGELGVAHGELPDRLTVSYQGSKEGSNESSIEGNKGVRVAGLKNSRASLPSQSTPANKATAHKIRAAPVDGILSGWLAEPERNATVDVAERYAEEIDEMITAEFGLQAA